MLLDDPEELEVRVDEPTVGEVVGVKSPVVGLEGIDEGFDGPDMGLAWPDVEVEGFVVREEEGSVEVERPVVEIEGLDVELEGLSVKLRGPKFVELLPLDDDTPGVVDGSPVPLEVPELDPLDVGEVARPPDPVLVWPVVPVRLPLEPITLDDKIVVLEG